MQCTCSTGNTIAVLVLLLQEIYLVLLVVLQCSAASVAFCARYSTISYNAGLQLDSPPSQPEDA